jgi:hypothetical protein
MDKCTRRAKPIQIIGGPDNQHRIVGVLLYLFAMSVIDPRFLGRPARSLSAIHVAAVSVDMSFETLVTGLGIKQARRIERVQSTWHK